MTDISAILSPVEDAPADLHRTIDTYRNQGGLLGIVTYFLIYLQTSDEEVAETGASIPTYLFVLGSLHDDAVDEAGSQDGNLKQFLNRRMALGDQLFTYIVEFCSELPDEFDATDITERMRDIGDGQLREEEITSTDVSVEEAVERVEQRGSVWGRLAVSPVEAAGYYSESRLEHVYTFCENLLFVLTVVDDVEDIPEDIENDVVNIPLLLFGRDHSEFSSNETMIEAVLESDVPHRLDELCKERESEMEAAARQFFERSQYSNVKLLSAWNRALEWYRDSVCTVPVDRTIPANDQREIERNLTGSSEQRRRHLEEVVADFPVRVSSKREYVSVVDSLPGDELVPAVILMCHIETLIDSLMTTDLDDAFDNLRDVTTGD